MDRSEISVITMYIHIYIYIYIYIYIHIYAISKTIKPFALLNNVYVCCQSKKNKMLKTNFDKALRQNFVFPCV